ncbi:EAL domain, c-di-GMP-specific phosphodiesterase class I (or its enzymatically inactive variant) [Devosia lucknowensis]|uniref:EAL domain, c-di-GMP-specific phosphodiesterase class I (Or its enzymatically inactive variant) n=1 Tax=Devosia lucknowensis TaxID=1096929 RepID=A0A1Y6EVY3_9HYPH|nr:EAL domain-containing protein [Devosia lucknowensis]SMQ66369.1 EAL domain, c-di-GMP-specific phosphodiesterase class I (or its enzymatically inactive variant) [Devosia lucknowensis]
MHLQSVTTDELASAVDERPMVLSPQVTESISRVLRAIRQHLHMDIAFVTQFLGSSRVFRTVDSNSPVEGVFPGSILPIASGYCQHVVSGRLPELIPDTSRVPFAMGIAETATIPIGAHLSVPIRLEGGRIFGTFCCFSHRAMPDLGEAELDLMHTFSRLIAREMQDDVARDERQQRIIRDVQLAMANGDPQIVFQPILRLADNRIVGLEALSRFRAEPYRTPDIWFHEAAEVGMGTMLELMALRRVLQQAGNLPQDLSIHLNVSPAAVISPELPAALAGFDPNRVIIEITEHEPVADYEPILDALMPLRAAGIRIAIDDAGAGYSSLRHVLMMRPDMVKLDVSLTRGLDSDPIRHAMAAALTEFSRRTGTIIVAEGVETDAELAALRGLGVSEVQGYLIARPQPAEDVLAKIA